MNMTSAIKNILILVLLLFSSAFPQSILDNQFNFAMELYNEEKYFDAVTEFKRLLFFDDGNEYSFSANYFIADSYKAGGKFSEAIRFFTAAEISARTSDDVYKIKIEIIKVNIIRRTTGRALRLIDEMQNDSRFVNKADELYYWKGWSYIFADKWKQASEEFYKIKPDHELFSFSENIYDSLYDETLARVLSYIIPGAGQVYTGEYLSGFLSLSWNVLWGYLSINAFVEERIFDGFVIANFLWLRFYNGNIHNAGKFVEIKNAEITNRALDYLQYEYSGPKP